jgi:hypothetical protein
LRKKISRNFKKKKEKKVKNKSTGVIWCRPEVGRPPEGSKINPRKSPLAIFAEQQEEEEEEKGTTRRVPRRCGQGPRAAPSGFPKVPKLNPSEAHRTAKSHHNFC